MKKNNLLLFLLTYFIFIFLNLLITHYEFYYDGARNEKIMIEFAKHNTITYYAFPYINNPPMYFILGGLIVKIFGTKQIIFKIMELTLYYFSALLIYYFLKKEKTKHSLIAFFIFLTDVAIIHLHNIDYVAIICLLTILTIITYNNFDKKPSLKNAIIFGIIGFLSFLTKSSFLFLFLPIYFHAFIKNYHDSNKLKLIFLSGIILSTGQLIWESYLYINNLPLIPNLAELSGNIEWSENKNFNPFNAFIYSLKEWNVLYFLALFLIILKKDYKSVFSYVLFLTPLLTSIILRVYPEEAMTSIMIFSLIYVFKNFNFKKKNLLIYFILLLFFFRINSFKKTDLVFYKNSIEQKCSYFSFVKNLNANETLLDVMDYAYLNLISPAYVEHNQLIEKDITTLIAVNVNYASFFEEQKNLIQNPITSPVGVFNPKKYFKEIKQFNCYFNKTNKTIIVYSFNSTSFFNDLGLKYYFDVKINNVKNKDSQSRIQVNGINFTSIYFTNKIGEKRIFVNQPGLYKLIITKTGYKEKEYYVLVLENNYAKILTLNEIQELKNKNLNISTLAFSKIIEVNLTKTNPFYHKVAEIRY